MSVLFNDTVMWTNVTEFNRGSWCLRTLTFSLALLRSKIRASTFSCKTAQSSDQENLSRMPSGCFISTQPATNRWYKPWRKVSFSWDKRKCNCYIWTVLESKEVHHTCSNMSCTQLGGKKNSPSSLSIFWKVILLIFVVKYIKARVRIQFLQNLSGYTQCINT